ncbi:MAG: chorismate synthase, partial [Deltaproteobacteria bacterium]|nr:chorismate synthase [Deltaproteobacteria bacterium]
MGSLTGRNFAVMTFGESHGPALGVVIDGLPAGLPISEEDVQRDLDRRRPGRSPYASPRREDDRAEILSGTSQGLTNGAPLAILVRNRDARPADYEDLKTAFRPGHADW